jgi:hypothetical protein
MSFLNGILYDKPLESKKIIFEEAANSLKNIGDLLKQYGPALVSGFQVSAEFKDQNKDKHVVY